MPPVTKSAKTKKTSATDNGSDLKKGKAPASEPGKVVYPKIVPGIHKGKDAITEDYMKSLLGWTVVQEGEKYHLIDHEGNFIFCTNNTKNRPIYKPNLENLEQNHLNRRWRFNGEPIIVGEYGAILNGQHSGISLILANQTRRGKQAAHWESIWPGEVTMEKLIIFGVPEDDDVVNTIDTAKGRSLSDAIFRSGYFPKLTDADKKQASRILEYALRLLWTRTGAKKDAFAPRRTHSESLDFIERHPKLLEATEHVLEENKDGKITELYSPGYAAAMLYLMASGESDADDYRNADPRDESTLEWQQWDKACDFWVAFASPTKDLKALRDAMKALTNPDGSGGSTLEKNALICLAWDHFSAGKTVTPASLNLTRHYEVDGKTGIKTFTGKLTVGGIDLGDVVDEPKEVWAKPKAEKVRGKKAKLGKEVEAEEEEILTAEEVDEPVGEPEDHAGFTEAEDESEEEEAPKPKRKKAAAK